MVALPSFFPDLYYYLLSSNPFDFSAPTNSGLSYKISQVYVSLKSLKAREVLGKHASRIKKAQNKFLQLDAFQINWTTYNSHYPREVLLVMIFSKYGSPYRGHKVVYVGAECFSSEAAICVTKQDKTRPHGHAIISPATRGFLYLVIDFLLSSG